MARFEKPLLTDVALEEGTIVWEMEFGTQHNQHWLSEPDVTVLRETWGYNDIEEKKRNECLEFLKHFRWPMPIMIWLAILIEAIQSDWMDFAVLCVLKAMNNLVVWYEESNASDAIKALRMRHRSAMWNAVVRKNTELVKIISTIANTNDVGHFEIIIYSITLFLVAVSLILVCFIMAVLFYNTYGLLKTLGFCVVLLVASIPIAMQVVCTSTMALSCLGRETSHFVLVGIHRGTF